MEEVTAAELGAVEALDVAAEELFSCQSCFSACFPQKLTANFVLKQARTFTQVNPV